MQLVHVGQIKNWLDITCYLATCIHSKGFVRIGPPVKELLQFLNVYIMPPSGQVGYRNELKFGLQGNFT